MPALLIQNCAVEISLASDQDMNEGQNYWHMAKDKDNHQPFLASSAKPSKASASAELALFPISPSHPPPTPPTRENTET